MTQASKQHALPVPASRPTEPQKGWLHRWTRKQWCRHWFVLNAGSLTYYRKPEFEHYSFLDGVLDLSLISRIEVAPEPAASSHHHTHLQSHHLLTNQLHQLHSQHQASAGTHFAFSLCMWNGECHLLSAGSAAERSLWLAAINECADTGCLEDDPETDSASSSDSSPTSNLSAKSLDAGPPLPQWRSTHHRCDQLAISIKSAIRRRDQQNNHSLKFLSDLHAGLSAKLVPDTNSNDNNNNTQLQHTEDNLKPYSQDRLLSSAASENRYPLIPASNEVHKSTPLTCWPPSQRSRLQQHQLDQSSQEVAGMQQQKVALQESQDDEEPSFKKRPLFGDSVYKTESASDDIPCVAPPDKDGPIMFNDNEHDDEEEQEEEQEDESKEEELNKKELPQKKRVTFDLSLSSLYQLTSSSGSEESDDQEEDQRHRDSNDDLSDSGGESLSPSSSLSSCVSEQEEQESDLRAEPTSIACSSTHQRKIADEFSSQSECIAPEVFTEISASQLSSSLKFETPPTQIEELKQQLGEAQQEVGSLQRDLSSSYTSYGQLELTCQRLRGDLLACDENKKQEIFRLQARVEELSRELATSQQELLEAQRRLIELKQAQQDHNCAASKERATTGASRNQSWLRLHQQVGSHQPLLLMHHVKHTIAANQQLLGAKLLNHSKQIQRKLNELELKVDKIQLNSSLVN